MNATLVFLLMAWAGFLGAREPRTEAGVAPDGVSAPRSAYVQPFGVALAPPIYFVNFLLLYFSNPEIAAYMPAYRAALPQQVYECLVDNPDGCPYADMAGYFSEQALESGGGSRNRNTFWPGSCRTDPRWESLAPREYRRSDQVNEPLGRKKADQLARLLGIDQDMILTPAQYACLIGTPPRGHDRQIIFVCSNDLTNSNGHAIIPLSSYGLSLSDEGDVRSNCAPQAPCLEFNQLFAGPLEAIAAECGFEDKLARLVTETPMLEFVDQGNDCQHAWEPACIAEAACPGNGARSNNSCAPSIASP